MRKTEIPKDEQENTLDVLWRLLRTVEENTDPKRNFFDKQDVEIAYRLLNRLGYTDNLKPAGKTNMSTETLLCEPVKCRLVGVDGNAFSLMAHWQQCARKAGRTKEEIKAVLDLAMTSDYDHLIHTLDRHSK